MRRLPLLGTVAAVVTVLPVSSCLAEQVTQEPTIVLIRGFGNDSCGKFLASVEGLPLGKVPMITYQDGQEYWSKAGVYANWIEGYISGVNTIIDVDPFRSGAGQYQPSKQIGVDYLGTELWIRKWCNTHPAESLYYAVASFIRSRWGLLRQK
jgi:hypothetical protein